MEMVEMDRRFCAFLLVGVLLTILSPGEARAYIDPGTGATFVGSMGPLIVGIIGGALGLFLKIFWHPLKRLFSRGKGSSEEQSSSE